MTIDVFDNILMLAATIIGILICLFRYIEVPKRGWLHMTVFFLASFLSDYYWTTYTLVMHESPDVSALMAYFGWNVSFLFLLVSAIDLRHKDVKGFFHPLMLLPIPVNLFQFFIYIQYGGIFNNVWQCTITTITACFCIQSIFYYLRHHKDGAHFPYLHTAILLYVFCQYGMWTCSCYEWEILSLDPFYLFSFASYLVSLFFGWAVGRDYECEGFKYPERAAVDIRMHIVLQIIVSAIILGCCAGGFYLASWMKKALPGTASDSRIYDVIAVMLFIFSVVLVLLILAVIYVVASRYRSSARDSREYTAVKRRRFNLFFTLLITFILMTLTIVYNSRIFYRSSVTNVYEAGEDKVAAVAADLMNYLSKAVSTLKVTADSVEIMINNGVPLEDIEGYLIDQTTMQKSELDENFTGLYGYIQGEYLDGLGWVPPADYVVEERDWYNAAIEGGGSTVIVSPYVDAQTGSVVITITKLLSGGDTGSDGKPNVVSLDVIMNYIQEQTELVDLGGKGYAMIINDDGLIVAHRDQSHNGKVFDDILGSDLMDRLRQTGSGRIEAVVEGEESTLFVSRVMDQWYVVIAVGSDELFDSVRTQLMINIVIFLFVFGLISFFYYISYMNEQAYSKKMEEMSAGRQKQEYEAEMLRLEKRAADEANRAKSSFLADMSHEIRTPINAILGMNEMVMRESNDSNIREYAKNIDISGRSLLRLINSILDFSKIEDGKMEIIPVSYSLNSLITYLVNSVREKADTKGLEFTVDIDPTLPARLYGDDARVNQIILNLLTNAIKYTHEGSVTLHMIEKERDKDRVLIYVEVKDTGIGIKESDMKRLFESFERLDEKRNRNIEGTGLGISITTKLLALMDSELKVESTYGQGSSFYFELWQTIDSNESLGEYRLPSADEAGFEHYTESFHAPDARILIVDDTRMNLTVAVSLLKNTKIRIDTATGGEEAISLSKENTYDIILMDQRMPVMSGTEAMNRIKALENGKNASTPVICLTADAIRGAREKYIAEGFTDYLTKPVDGVSLEKTLLKYLPAEKVLRPENPEHKESVEEALEASGSYAALREAGIDTAAGLNYSMNSEDVYTTILGEYASEYTERRRKLDEYFLKKDWKEYSILIHALKSTSKTIGAMNLSGLAAMLEAAANDGDEPTIASAHEKTMEMYLSVITAIKSNIAVPKNSDTGDDDDDDDILEFSPSDTGN